MTTEGRILGCATSEHLAAWSLPQWHYSSASAGNEQSWVHHWAFSFLPPHAFSLCNPSCFCSSWFECPDPPLSASLPLLVSLLQTWVRLPFGPFPLHDSAGRSFGFPLRVVVSGMFIVQPQPRSKVSWASSKGSKQVFFCGAELLHTPANSLAQIYVD